MVFLCLNVNRLFELLLVKSIYTGCLIFVDIKEVNEWENVNYHPIKLVFDEHHFQFIRTSDKLCITSSSSSLSLFLIYLTRMNSEQKINFYIFSSIQGYPKLVMTKIPIILRLNAGNFNNFHLSRSYSNLHILINSALKILKNGTDIAYEF